MNLDLNNPHEFTREGVSKLIASKDDSQDRQLRVTVGGIAFLSDDIGADDIEGLAFRFETWSAGNDYVGEAASRDDEWVNRVYLAMCKNWPNPTTSYLDTY